MRRLDELNVVRALRETDPDLKLDKHYREACFLCYVVVYTAMPPSDEPYKVAYGRADNMASLDLVDAIRANEGDLTESLRTVKAHNWAERQRRKQQELEMIEEAVREHNLSTGRLKRHFHDGARYIYS